MNKLLTLLLTGMIILFTTIPGMSQERYLDEIFTDVQVTHNVMYSFNFSIEPALFVPTISDTIQIPQLMDVYEPMGDTATNRPVIIFGITGTFLPRIVNQGFTGTRGDSTNVAFATAMAKKGYVVAVVEYRKGWVFLGPALTQQKTILDASYRGIQDMRAAVRYFRATEQDSMNMWGVDPGRIAVGGTGTGAYMSYGATYLDRYEQTLLEKFIDFTDPLNPVPFLDTLIYGNPEGTDSAYINAPQHPGFSSKFNMGFAFGGALGDPSWVEDDDPPFVAVHSYRDPFQPYAVGNVFAADPTTMPPTPFAVIPTASGPYSTLDSATRLGNQDIFKDVEWGDPVSERAAMINDGRIGLYPFITPYTPGDAMCEGVGVAGDTLQEWGTCWSWFDEATGQANWDTTYKDLIAAGAQIPGSVAVCVNKRGFPNDAAVAKMYLDTAIMFLTPRLAIALELGTSVGVDKFLDAQNFEVFPNPSSDVMHIEYKGVDGKPIDHIQLMDISGRVVRSFSDVNSSSFEIQKDNLTEGLYILQIRVGEKMANKKIMFN
ncbi:MAG: T9SS type A sorting domain-containing protein [Bacteroidota bacterium]